MRIRIVFNKLLDGWYVVRGPHQAPLGGRFPTKAAAQAWLNRRKLPAPLSAGALSDACVGTGADIERTLGMASYDSGYVRCHACNGNGLDPVHYSYPRSA